MVRRPFTVGIAGAHSCSGKTSLASAILRRITKSPFRLPRGGAALRWGAIKYSKSSLYTSLIDDPGTLRQEGKDTRIMLDAGAAEVLMVKAPREDLENVMPLAMDRLSGLDGVMIEGNSAIEFINPDIVLFMVRGDEERIKPSALQLKKSADIVILWDEGSRSEDEKGAVARDGDAAPGRQFIMAVRDFAGPAIERLVSQMEEISKRKLIENLLIDRSVDGRIACAVARGIAEELDVPYQDVGNAANALKIKVRECELGCF
jgi:LAO/AO transport system kinase